MNNTIKVLKWKKCIVNAFNLHVKKKMHVIRLQDPYNLSPGLVFRIKWDWMMEANDPGYILIWV